MRRMQLGDRHQRAGVAAGDGGGRLAGLHRLDGVPHAGALAAAHGLGGLLVSPDHALGVADLDVALERRQLADSGLQRGLVAVQQEAQGPAVKRAAGLPVHAPLGTPSLTTRATAGATTEGPWSPPIASMEITSGSGTAVSMLPAGPEQAAC